MSDLLDWEVARRGVIEALTPLPAREQALSESLGHALAQPMVSTEDFPAFANSAMDGFAVQAQDTAGATENDPVALTVVELLHAGSVPSRRLGPGEAARIMTGAPVPEGADAIVPVEHTNFWNAAEHRSRIPTSSADAAELRVHRPARSGIHIRKAGEAVQRGDEVLPAGHRLRAVDLSLLTALGLVRVNVHPLPRVAVLSTGSELVPADQKPGPGEIRDSNRPGLLARLKELGYPSLDLGYVGDEEGELTERILRGAREADFLVTSGGVSVGDADLTRRVLGRVGVVSAYRVAVKPGKPQVFGHVDGTPVFGLPGNPVSSLVVFDQFVLPGLRRLAGRSRVLPICFHARLETPIRRKPGRTEFVRVTLTAENGDWVARSTGSQGSGILNSLSRGTGYAVLPAEAASLDAGCRVLCQLFDRD